MIFAYDVRLLYLWRCERRYSRDHAEAISSDGGSSCSGKGIVEYADHWLGETQREHFHRLLRLAEANVERSRPQILDAIQCSLRRKKQECHARAAASSGSVGGGH